MNTQDMWMMYWAALIVGAAFTVAGGAVGLVLRGFGWIGKYLWRKATRRRHEMIDKRGGGPAFPQGGKGGMSLRDWFAGQALAGMLANVESYCDDCQAAYEIADRMIAERAKEKKDE